MFHGFSPFAKGGAFVFAAFLTVSPAVAQPSTMGHAYAPGTRPVYSRNLSLLTVYPGDKGFHSTMMIERYYQTLAHITSSTAPSPVAPPRYSVRSAFAAAPNVVVSIGEPAARPVMVDVRGPDGRLRSFPVAGGQAAIQPRTIVVHPGEKLTILFNSARAEAPKKQ